MIYIHEFSFAKLPSRFFQLNLQCLLRAQPASRQTLLPSILWVEDILPDKVGGHTMTPQQQRAWPAPLLSRLLFVPPLYPWSSAMRLYITSPTGKTKKKKYTAPMHVYEPRSRTAVEVHTRLRATARTLTHTHTLNHTARHMYRRDCGRKPSGHKHVFWLSLLGPACVQCALLSLASNPPSLRKRSRCQIRGNHSAAEMLVGRQSIKLNNAVHRQS